MEKYYARCFIKHVIKWRLPLKTMLHVLSSLQECPFCSNPQGYGDFGLHCERLRTVADSCGWQSNSERTHLHPETPKVKQEPSATHSGKIQGAAALHGLQAQDVDMIWTLLTLDWVTAVTEPQVAVQIVQLGQNKAYLFRLSCLKLPHPPQPSSRCMAMLWQSFAFPQWWPTPATQSLTNCGCFKPQPSRPSQLSRQLCAVAARFGDLFIAWQFSCQNVSHWTV